MVSEVQEIWQLPVARYNFITCFLRSFAGHATASFLPLFFQMKYSTIADDYSNVNAFALAIVGLMSSIIFGYVVDWANHYTCFAKTFIIVLGSLTAPFCMHVLTATDNFNIAGLMWISKYSLRPRALR